MQIPLNKFPGISFRLWQRPGGPERVEGRLLPGVPVPHPQQPLLLHPGQQAVSPLAEPAVNHGPHPRPLLGPQIHRGLLRPQLQQAEDGGQAGRGPSTASEEGQQLVHVGQRATGVISFQVKALFQSRGVLPAGGEGGGVEEEDEGQEGGAGHGEEGSLAAPLLAEAGRRTQDRPEQVVEEGAVAHCEKQAMIALEQQDYERLAGCGFVQTYDM